jgi:hypothetical protein
MNEPDDPGYFRTLSVRLHTDTIARAERLAARVDDPDLLAVMPRGLSRHAVLRLAIETGLREIEARTGDKGDA